MIKAADIFKARILVVDDQAANVLLLVKMLANAGYVSVDSTTNSEKVCELHLIHHYDLILLDLEMPGMDGFQVMKNLKEIEKGGYLPVLVVTAHREKKLLALQAGAKDFLGKPFEAAEILARVHNMLEVRLLWVDAKRSYDQIVAEQKISARLMLDLLPRSVMTRLQARPEGTDGSLPGLIADSWAEFTVLFADVLDFTKFSESASADVLAGVLNDASTRLGGDAAAHSVARDRTISEAHMALIGMPDGVANRTIHAANKAMDLVQALERFNGHSRYKLKVRIGIEANGPPGAPAGKRKIKRTFDV